MILYSRAGSFVLDSTSSIGPTLPVTRPDSEESQRKLWIEYIRRLGDRHAASIGRSGASTWALFGVLAAILYTCLPQIPSFLASPKNWRNQLVLLTVATDMVMFFVVAYALLVYYCMGGMEGRALPEFNRRFQSVAYLAIISLELVLATAHLFAVGLADVRGFVFRSVVLLFGFLWTLEVILKLRNLLRNIQRARKYHVPLPWFAGTAVDAGRSAVVLFALLSLLSLAALATIVWYSHILVRSGEEWVKPLAASGYSIAFAAAAAILLMRGFQRIGAIPYDSLESEIVCENLSSSEIKERFAAYILGSSAAEWLTQQTELLKKADKAMDEARISIDATFKDVQSCRREKSYKELHSDIEKLLKTFGDATQTHKDAVERHRFLIGEFARCLGGQRKTPAFTFVMSEWKAQLAQMVEAAKLSSELRKRLIEFSQSVQGTSTPE